MANFTSGNGAHLVAVYSCLINLLGVMTHQICKEIEGLVAVVDP